MLAEGVVASADSLNGTGRNVCFLAACSKGRRAHFSSLQIECRNIIGKLGTSNSDSYGVRSK